MSIPDSFIMELKMKCNIEDIISSYVQLSRKGKYLVGLCPFHSEKTGSFTVFPEKQNYFCFGCQAGGDVINFVRSIEHLDYVDAIKSLALKAGMAVPENNEEKGPNRKKIYEINKKAARFYYNCLAGDMGKAAREYLVKRKLDVQTVKHFGIGFAPDGWQHLLDYLKKEGFYLKDIKEAGLCVEGKKGNHYDSFRNRLMIPIFDSIGNIVGFGGRNLGDIGAKYLNSPDTVVFKKSSMLFNLNNAKNKSEDFLILTEGYMDTIALSQAGFKNTVASLGTAFTDEHARLIARYAGDGGAVIAFDSDAAGQNATAKAVKKLEETGARIRVVNLGDSKDPDDFIKAHGAAGFRKIIELSGNPIEYRLSGAKAKFDLEKEDGKLGYTKEAVRILAGESSLIKDLYAGKISEEIGISKEAILNEIKFAVKAFEKKKKQNELKEEETSEKRDRITPDRADKLKAAKAEEGLISILFYAPEYRGEILKRITVDDFVTSLNRRVFAKTLQIIESGLSPDTTLLGEDFLPEEMGKITKILLDYDIYKDNERKTIDDFVLCLLSEKSKPASAADLKAESINDYIKKDLAEKKRVKGNSNG